jgi:hypothetical protein
MGLNARMRTKRITGSVIPESKFVATLHGWSEVAERPAARYGR